MMMADLVKPLPAVTYSFSEIHTALRQFSTAKHVGKIVIKLPDGSVEDGRSDASADLSSQMKTWVIVGGLGALGTIAARHLVGQGRKNIQLLGRSGRLVTSLHLPVEL